MSLEVLALGLAAIGTGSTIVSANEARKDAATQAREQKRQAALQARQQQIAAQRSARLRRAAIVASQAAQGTRSSVAASGLEAITAQSQQQQDIIQQQLGLQQRQFDLAAQSTASQAAAQIGGALGSFAATALTPYGQENLSLTERAFGFGSPAPSIQGLEE